MTHLPISVNEEISQSLVDGVPVIALESNVIAHGLDYPANVRAARAVEDAVREGGAVPATIAIVDGRIIIGVNTETIDRLATEPGLPKVSNRDIGPILASGRTGATTVASSLALAELAGIRYFASAGLGGVHRGAPESMDISADLIQLTRSRVIAVCAGVKNILDIALTLEYLETQGIPVVSFRSDDFPAFYCRTSGHRSPFRVDDPQEINTLAQLHWAAGSPTGVVVTVPPTAENALDFHLAEQAVQEAMGEAKNAGITGKAVTRYLMKTIDRFTDGQSAEANQAVLISTARAAATIAVGSHVAPDLYGMPHTTSLKSTT